MGSLQVQVLVIALVILILAVSLVPYKKESFEMDVNLNRMSCKDFLNKIPDNSIITSINGNLKREHVLADMDRAVVPTYTPDGVIYNDTEYCILRKDKLHNYRMTDACKLGDYQLLQTDKNNYQPDGCVINPRDTWFIDFMDQAFYNKNQDMVDEINKVMDQAQQIQNQKDALAKQLQNMTNQYTDAATNAANATAQLNALQTQYNNQLLQYQALMKKMQTLFGRDPDSPAVSAASIRQASGTGDNGVYYINCGGVSKQVFCIMDPRYDGGGWMMLMKMAPGSTFHYYSSFWTNANTLNEGSLDMSEQDAKFDVFNKVGVKDVMAIFPSSQTGVVGGCIPNNIGWTWLVNNWFRNGEKVTALSGFNMARDANPSDPYAYCGYTTSIWGSQEPSRRHVFGGHAHLGPGWSGAENDWGSVRWGFVFNENGYNDFKSNDVWGGIGGGNRYGGNLGGGQYFSAGDYFGCCGRPGINRKISAFVFGR
jgi:hypothetical protein